MIQIHINPTKVEKVVFVSGSPLEEDFDFAAWQVIRELVDQMDNSLRLAVQGEKNESDAQC